MIPGIRNYHFFLFQSLECYVLYYKHITIVNDDSSFINKVNPSLTDDTRVVIYDCNFCSFKMAILESSGLYNKHTTIVNDDSSVISKRQVSLIDDARVIIYDRNMFTTEATGLKIAI